MSTDNYPALRKQIEEIHLGLHLAIFGAVCHLIIWLTAVAMVIGTAH